MGQQHSRFPEPEEQDSFTKYAVIAGSSTGSTWVNHVLSSHPCVHSEDEFLMRRTGSLKAFHQSPQGIGRVLDVITERGLTSLQLSLPQRIARNGGRPCRHSAVGVKLKIADRDITLGATGNVKWVSEQLSRKGWRIILLQRRNLLDRLLAQRSREGTRLHCVVGKCNPFWLNTSHSLDCETTLSHLRWRHEQVRLIDDAFESWEGSGQILRLEYEHLLKSANSWPQALKFLGFASFNESCKLREEHQKRVQQTHREMIANVNQLVRCFKGAGHPYNAFLHLDERPASGPLPIEVPALCPHASSRNAQQEPVDYVLPTHSWFPRLVSNRSHDVGESSNRTSHKFAFAESARRGSRKKEAPSYSLARQQKFQVLRQQLAQSLAQKPKPAIASRPSKPWLPT
mmetsp:Transcript_46604/g.77036  ORF Transcript_46604/g.77036 Transcript_46604/m.77036 type:complete len:400 (-) Transcript_46604:365-1564(-)